MLIVDDDEDMRSMLQDFIGKMGISVRPAAGLVEAQRFLRGEVDPFDLVMTDLRLPDGSGLEVVRAAHARKPGTLVSIITGYASLETAIEAIRLGAYDYITKPFTLDQIGVQVRNMIQRVLLARENARLSLRIQELYQEVHRLQAERVDAAGHQDEILRHMAEAHRKLDQLLACSLGDRHPPEGYGNDLKPPLEMCFLEAGDIEETVR